jgi:hypothetical protein
MHSLLNSSAVHGPASQQPCSWAEVTAGRERGNRSKVVVLRVGSTQADRGLTCVCCPNYYSSVNCYCTIRCQRVVKCLRTGSTRPTGPQELVRCYSNSALCGACLTLSTVFAHFAGDENGRMPSRVKAEAVVVNCTQCMGPIRMSKSNADARLHWESKHPSCTFATCFPGQFDPTVPGASPAPSGATNTAPVVQKAKPKANTGDLSFLDAALASNPVKGKAGK